MPLNNRTPVPLWRIVPFLLAPPALVAGISLYLNWPPTLFLHISVLCSVALLLLVASPQLGRRWALAGALLGLLLVSVSWLGELGDFAASAAVWVQINWWAGISALLLGVIGLLLGR